jgi:hypothetical protein
MYQLGAINVITNEYVLPYKAEKNNKYKCIDCQKKVVLKKGNVRKCHFAHYSQNNCSYYEHPNESELHKEAKYKIASWLKENKSIMLIWECCKIEYNGKRCETMESGMEFNIHYEENDTVIIEHRDTNNKYIADVAVINNNKIKYIFEIKHTHSTSTNIRPEPWFEIKSQEIFEIENKDDEDIILTCIRNNKNRYCSNCRILDEEWVNNLPRLYNKNGDETNWTQKNPCIKCTRTAYSPVFANGYRQLCKICLSIYEDELKQTYDITGKCLIKIK